jgi:hypothetical protein
MAKKRKKKWIQGAEAEMERKGTKGSYGSHSEKQQKRDIKRGGKIGKKAQFALNMRKIAARRKRRHGARRLKRRTRR